MYESGTLVLAWVAGLLLGAMFFGGLWWTVRMGTSSPRVALWFLGSLLLRISMALVGFYYVSGGHWQRLVTCFVGFIMARLIVMWLTRPSGEHRHRTTQEVHHAPES